VILQQIPEFGCSPAVENIGTDFEGHWQMGQPLAPKVHGLIHRIASRQLLPETPHRLDRSLVLVSGQPRTHSTSLGAVQRRPDNRHADSAAGSAGQRNKAEVVLELSRLKKLHQDARRKRGMTPAALAGDGDPAIAVSGLAVHGSVSERNGS